MQAASGTLPRPRRRRNAARPAAYALALAVAAVVIVPVAYVVLGGFRTTGQVAAQPVALPDPWVFSNYGEVLRSGSFWRQVATSLLIAVMATAATVALGAGAAFALARYAFKGREALFTYFTLGLLFPVGVGILPLYILLRQLGLVDTPFGVALPEAAFGLPITIVILRPFMRAIPGELEDAAAMDGCTRFGFFWRILLPLYRRAGWRLRRVLTDGGPEFKGAFDEACHALGLRHTRTKPRHAWTNGFVERLQGTILQEHWRVAFRRRYFTSRTALQRSLEGFMQSYNHERPHQGYRLRGRTPAALFWGAARG